MRQHWFADDPRPERATSLGRSSFAELLLDAVRSLRETQPSTVLGLVGPWGSGKTSVLEWLTRSLRRNQDQDGWVVINFNPWDYQDATSLQAGFFSELSEGLGSDQQLARLRTSIARFGRAVAPLGGIGSLVGLDLSGPIAGAASLLEGNQSVTVARTRLSNALVQAKQPVLVIIDDLDRVSAEELLLTLKLVRQLGRLPYVHYVLSYDEATVVDVLSRTSLVGPNSSERARSYLEKVVQLRFDLPALRPSDVLQLTNAALSELEAVTRMAMSEADTTRFSTAYFKFVAQRLTTPRALNRFFAQAHMMTESLRGEIDVTDFLVITWIRAFEPGVYSLLQRHRDELLGERDLAFGSARGDDARHTQHASWLERLGTAGVARADVEGVAAAMGFVFPRFASIWAESAPSTHRVEPPRAAHRAYFDRYFSMGLPEDDVPDATVREALGEKGSSPSEAKTALVEVERVFHLNHALVIGKISHALSSGMPVSPRAFAWIAALAKQLPDTYGFASPRHQLEMATGDHLRILDAQDVDLVLEQLLKSDGVELAIGALDWAIHDSTPGSTGGNSLALTANQSEQVAHAFRSAVADAAPDQMAIRMHGLAYAWQRISPTDFTSWIRELRVRYDDLQVLCFFVNVAVPVGGRAPQSRLEEFQAADAAKYFDLQEVAVRLGEAVDNAPMTSRNTFDHFPDTPENRRLVVLEGLRKLKQ